MIGGGSGSDEGRGLGTGAWAERLHQRISDWPTDDSGFHLPVSQDDLAAWCEDELQDRIRFIPEWRRFVVRDETTLIWDSSERAHTRAGQLVLRMIRQLGNDMNLRRGAYIGLKSYATHRAVMAMLSEREALVRGLDDWDRDPDVMQTPGGVAELASATLRDNTLADFMLNCTQVTPDFTGAMTGSMTGMTAIETIMGTAFAGVPEQRDYLWSELGASMAGGNPEQAIRWAIGASKSGKTTIMMALVDALGSYAMVCPSNLVVPGSEPLSSLHKRATMAQLARVRFALVDEVNRQGQMDVVLLKQMANGTRQPTEEKFQRMRSAVVKVNVWVVSNNVPERLRGSEDGIERRLRVVEWDGAPAKADFTLAERVRLEAPALLGRCLLEARDWYLFGSRAMPDSSREIVEGITQETHLIPAWFDECWEVTGNQHDAVWSCDLWNHFANKWWPQQDAAKSLRTLALPVTEIDFMRKVKRLITVDHPGHWAEKVDIKGVRKKGYRGVKLK